MGYMTSPARRGPRRSAGSLPEGRSLALRERERSEGPGERSRPLGRAVSRWRSQVPSKRKRRSTASIAIVKTARGLRTASTISTVPGERSQARRCVSRPWRCRPVSLLFLQQRRHRAAACSRPAGAENRQVLAGTGCPGIIRPVFRFRSAVDRAYRIGESRAVSGGLA